MPEEKFEAKREDLLNFTKLSNHLKRKILSRCQVLGSTMMTLTQNKMHPGDVWNASQVFLGQTVSIDAGDLYILNSSLQRLAEIKDPRTQAVFKLILEIWALTVSLSDDTFS